MVIARDAGEGRQISVRGLGPQFTRVRINGMEAMSANGGTDAAGGTNRGRNFDFNTFASELFNNITVRKTASAEVEEGSLGATVDLRTGRPFDYDGFTIAGGRAGRLQRSAAKISIRARTFLDQQHVRRRQVRRAVFGGLHRAQTRRRRPEHGALDELRQPLTNCLTLTPANANTSCFGGLDATYVGHADAGADQQRVPPAHSALRPYEHEQERIGVTASLQFAPSDAPDHLDALYAEFDAERAQRCSSRHRSSARPATR